MCVLTELEREREEYGAGVFRSCSSRRLGHGMAVADGRSRFHFLRHTAFLFSASSATGSPVDAPPAAQLYGRVGFGELLGIFCCSARTPRTRQWPALTAS